MLTIQARVRRGVKLMDRALPDWRERIDPGKLDIKQVHKCVLGQVTGNFNTGLELTGLKYFESPDYGFEAFPIRGRTYEELDDEYNALNIKWRSVLLGTKNNS